MLRFSSSSWNRAYNGPQLPAEILGQPLINKHLPITKENLRPYSFHKIHLPMHGQYATYPFGSSSKADTIPILRQMNAKGLTHGVVFQAMFMLWLK